MKIRKFNENSDYISSLENPEDLFQDVIDEFSCDFDCNFTFFESDINSVKGLNTKKNYTNYILNNNTKAKYGYNYSFYFNDITSTNIENSPLFYIYESAKRKIDLIGESDIHILINETEIDVFIIYFDIIDISKFSELYKLIDHHRVSFIFDDRETLCILGPNSEKAYNSLFYIDSETGVRKAKKIYNSDFELEKEFEIEKIERLIKFKLRK